MKTKKKFYSWNPYDKILADYDYISKLSDKDKKWLMEFHDEFYNAKWVKDRTKSVFYSNKMLNNMKKIPKIYNDFKKLHREENKYRAELNEIQPGCDEGKKLTQLEFLVKLQQQEASRKKQKRRIDLFTHNFIQNTVIYEKNEIIDSKKTVNYSKVKNKLVAKNVMEESDESYDNSIESVSKEERPVDQDRFLLLLKNNRTPLFVAEKLIEIIDEQEASHSQKNTLINKIQENISLYNHNKLSNSEFSVYLYKIFTAIKILFKESEDTIVVKNVFEKIIFVKYMKDIKKFN